MKQSSLLTFLAILAIFHYANCTDSSKVCKNVPKKKDDSDEIAFAIVGKRKRLKCPLTEAYGDQATDVCWWFTNENGTKMHNLNNNNDSIYVINSTFLTILWNRVTLNDTVFLCQSSDGRIWEFKFDCNNATVCNNRGKCIEKHVGTPMHSVHCICSSSNYRGEYCEITKSPYPFLITIIFTCPIMAIVWLLLHGENPQMYVGLSDVFDFPAFQYEERYSSQSSRASELVVLLVTRHLTAMIFFRAASGQSPRLTTWIPPSRNDLLPNSELQKVHSAEVESDGGRTGADPEADPAAAPSGSLQFYFCVERDPKFKKNLLFNIISWLYRWKFVVIILNCKFLFASAWLQNLAPMEIVFENCVKLDLGQLVQCLQADCYNSAVNKQSV
ncbi:hypothetical protein T02_2925 [Trichinella nativa]|uniref:EGF-like domain-containing protein n=1 Tax=Trichinella nativa TaxID=6335 RepID=A0A0V1KRC6_9BILA|nr:hypothetical protein T02_2925 [Trichinella nativa]